MTSDRACSPLFRREDILRVEWLHCVSTICSIKDNGKFAVRDSLLR